MGRMKDMKEGTMGKTRRKVGLVEGTACSKA
jgi:hypothetical protein